MPARNSLPLGPLRIGERPAGVRSWDSGSHLVTGRVHRMTELFGRLAPGATLEQARSELQTVYGVSVYAFTFG